MMDDATRDKLRELAFDIYQCTATVADTPSSEYTTDILQDRNHLLLEYFAVVESYFKRLADIPLDGPRDIR